MIEPVKKVGRNDPCHCGSGKKFKQCHGAATKNSLPAGPTPVEAAAMQQVQTAMQLQQAGSLDEAERIYRTVLKQLPNHADALHLLGLLLHQRGHHRDAAASIEKAIRQSPRMAAFHHNCGEAYRAAGEFAKALACAETALRLQPDFAEAHVSHGAALRELGRYDEAAAAYRRALALRPNLRQAHLNLGHALRLGGHMDEALRAYGDAFNANIETAGGANAVGILLVELECYDEAGRLFQRGLELDPHSAELHNSFGTLMARRSRMAEAIECYGRAVALRPAYAEAYRNLGTACFRMGQFAQAISWFDKALACEPDDEDARFNLSYALLGNGDFERGWIAYESRFKRLRDPVAAQNFPIPVWKGESLKGKSLLVWDEQGVGDEIWLAGMNPDLFEMPDAPERVVIEARPKLRALFQRSFPLATVIAKSDPPDAACTDGIDIQTAAGSMGRYRRSNARSFPKRDGYLIADPARETVWKQRLAAIGPGLKVGICWRSSDRSGERALYSTTLPQWKPIFEIPGLQFVNLQYDECAAELSAAENMFGLKIHHYPEVDMFNDLDETAALMRGLDLVVTAPTAVGILSGAIGVPTWQMNYGEDWQRHGQAVNPWYPLMRRFIREWSESWDTVLARVADALKNLHSGEQKR